MSDADRSELAVAHAYLHGFASGPQARKGVALAKHYQAEGLELLRPDLNQPSFSKLSVGAMLAELDAMDAELRARAIALGQTPPRWRWIASSMGAWVGALWAQANPDRVDRQLLLCPAFFMTRRWPKLMGPKAFERWQRDGELPFADGAGVLQLLHFELVSEAEAFDPCPAPPEQVATALVHGLRDVVVDPQLSRDYASRHGLRLLEVDDEHPLRNSLPQIWDLAQQWLLSDKLPT